MSKSRPDSRAATSDPATAGALRDEGIHRQRCHIALAAILLLMFLTLCALSLKPVTWPHSHFNDMAILLSGENFARHGFIARHLLPVYFIGDISDQAGYYTYYSHTPPLFHLFNGVLQSVGITSLAVMRVICGGLFIVGMVCTYMAFTRDIGSLAAACGVGFIGTTGWFITYGMGLYDTTNFFFLGLFFLVFMRAVHRDGPAGRPWLGCWLLLLVASMNSYEFIVYAQVFAWAYAWAAGRLRATWRRLVPLAAAPVVGVGLHFLQVVWALGWTAAWADRLGLSYVRGGIAGLATRWESIKAVPDFLIGESMRMFLWPAHAVVLVGVLWLVAASRRGSDDPARRPQPLLLALLLASGTWFVAMPYAAVRNIYTIQQLVPLMLVVMGLAVAAVGRVLLARGTPAVDRCLAVLAGLVLVFGQITSLSRNAEGQGDQVAALAEAIGPNAFPPRVGILSNAGAVQFAYYTRRPWWHVPNMEPVPPMPFPESLPVLQKHLPPDCQIRYYVFASWGDPSPLPLLAANCPGRRLPLSGSASGPFLLLFDIGALHLPPDQRPPLDPEVKARQLRGEFPEWQIPGFRERLTRLLGPKDGA